VDLRGLRVACWEDAAEEAVVVVGERLSDGVVEVLVRRRREKGLKRDSLLRLLSEEEVDDVEEIEEEVAFRGVYAGGLSSSTF
jgi:hypothetical protein